LSTLFRSQVLSPRGDDHGRVVPWSAPHLRWWAALLVVWLVLAVVALAQLEYADKITVEGSVAPRAQPAFVRSAAVGVVSVVHVQDGARVSAQDPLITIDRRSHGIAGKRHDQLQVEQIQARGRAIGEATRRYRVLRRQEQALLVDRLAGVKQQRRTVTEQLHVLRQRLDLARTDARRQRGLAQRKFISQVDLHRGETALLAARESLLAQRSHSHQLQARADELHGQMQVDALQTGNRLADFEQQRLQLEHDIRRVQARGEWLVVAPVAGRVVDLVAHTGQPVAAGSVLLTVAPASSGLHPVEVHLPSQAVGRVRPGMPVRLRYAGYPFQEYGSGRGEIASVSEVNRADGREPSFRAQIAVVSLPADVDRVPAGMSVSADVLLQSRPLWAWLLEPLQGAMTRL